MQNNDSRMEAMSRVAALLRQKDCAADECAAASTSTDQSSLRNITSRVEQFLATASHVQPVMMEESPVLDACCGTTAVNEIDDAQQSDVSREAERAETMRFHGATAHTDAVEHGRSHSPVVELNIVAGVLEEKISIHHSGANQVSGVLLPTECTRAELDRRCADEAQAMVDLLHALSHAGHAPSYKDGSRRVGEPVDSHSKNRANTKLPAHTRRDRKRVKTCEPKQLNDAVHGEGDLLLSKSHRSSRSSSSSSSSSGVVVLHGSDLDAEDSSDDDWNNIDLGPERSLHRANIVELS